MKNLFVLLIFVPLFVSIKIPFTDWEWNWDFNWDFSQFIDNIKSGVPDFINNFKTEIQNFLKEDELGKRKWIKNLADKAKTEYDKIKNKTTEATENLAKLAEFTTQAAQYMSYQICNATNMESYEECRNNKKEVFSQLVQIVHDRFQCSKIITIVTENIIAGDVNQSLKYILFLITSITQNPDAIEKGKAQAIYDLISCLGDELENNLPEIIKNLPKNISQTQFKIDINSLLIQATENLVAIIHFEELDKYITEANKKTGLISDKNAKKIHKEIFKNLKKLNEFGSKFYNLSTTLAVNVTIKPETLNVKQQIVSEFKDKGIKIVLNSDSLFDKYKDAYSIQTVVFDSPLVSIKGERKKEGGTANTFVGITIYDSNGTELVIDNINLEDLRPIIYYKKNLFKAMTTCLYYNEEEDVIENKGVSTKEVNFDGEKYIRCIPKHLSSFTIGSYKSSKESNAGTIALVIILSLLIIGIAIGGYWFWRKRALREDSSQMKQAFPNKDGLLI